MSQVYETVAPELLNRVDAARFLGVHPRTIKRWTAQGRLPVVYLSRNIASYRVEDLREFINQHHQAGAETGDNQKGKEQGR